MAKVTFVAEWRKSSPPLPPHVVFLTIGKLSINKLPLRKGSARVAESSTKKQAGSAAINTPAALRGNASI